MGPRRRGSICVGRDFNFKNITMKDMEGMKKIKAN